MLEAINVNISNSQETLNRAFKAYARRTGKDVVYTEPSRTASSIDTIRGRKYAVLRNCNSVLEVYRVQNSGKLKRLLRHPQELEA